MPLRIMQLVLGLSPGGTERLVIEICRRLSGVGEVMVCCLDDPGEWAPELTGAGIRVTSLGRAGGFEPSLARRIARLVDHERIGMIHCHHYSPYVYGALATILRPSVGLVFTEHGRLSDAPPSRKRRLVNPWLSRLPGAVCAVSADLKKYLVQSGFPEDRVEVVYNGIADVAPVPQASRAALRAELDVPADAFLVMSIGRLDPVKNLSLLLRAFAVALAGDPRLSLAIIGDGPERAALEAQARELGLEGRVAFAGYRRDAARFLAAADLYVSSSTYEGVSLTILEAMAAGVPVVATEVGGNPEVVVHGETGLLVPGLCAPLSCAITGLARDEIRRRHFGDAARTRVVRHFSIDRMVGRYAELYQMYSANRNSAR
jgi:glycosyltransferase involved in cell wall biosynthesis